MKKVYIKILLIISIIVLVVWHFRALSQHNVDLSADRKKAIVIGASAGIGRALAKDLANHGYEVGITSRRIELLQELQKELPTKSYVTRMDIGNTVEATQLLEKLIAQMGGLDLIIINAGIGNPDITSTWQEQQKIIDVNVAGFAALATIAIQYFIKQKHGHLVGISSVTALRGIPNAYTYSASKAFISNYMQGLRSTMQLMKLPIYVTDIQPGFVDTDLVKDVKHKIWETSPEVAAQQIYTAIQSKQEHAYVTKRWRLFAWLAKYAPDCLFNRTWK